MTFSSLTLPALTINGYLWDTMKRIDPTLSQTKKYGKSIPFFPISDAASGTKSWENKTYVIYDRMMRSTPTSFYPIKKEHIIYYVKGNEENTLEWGMALQYILDRMDDAAQDINDWNRSQQDPANIYFHNLKAYQSGSGTSTTGGAQARDFSNRPYYITEFIVEAEYHMTEPLEFYLS